MKSSLKNMIMVLASICVVTSAALGFVYQLTAEPIRLAQENKLVSALSQVLPEFNNNPLETKQNVSVEVDGEQIETIVYVAEKDGEAVGYAITSKALGFSGDIELMTGFDKMGKIVNIQVLSMAETPGLGANMTNEDNVLLTSFKDKEAGKINMKVKKDGGDIDALTASTISSRAYANAVNRAYQAFLKVSATQQGEGGENE